MILHKIACNGSLFGYDYTDYAPQGALIGVNSGQISDIVGREGVTGVLLGQNRVAPVILTAVLLKIRAVYEFNKPVKIKFDCVYKFYWSVCKFSLRVVF